MPLLILASFFTSPLEARCTHLLVIHLFLWPNVLLSFTTWTITTFRPPPTTTSSPPLAPVSPRAPLHPQTFPSMATSTVLTTHLALVHCLVLFYP